MGGADSFPGLDCLDAVCEYFTCHLHLSCPGAVEVCQKISAGLYRKCAGVEIPQDHIFLSAVGDLAVADDHVLVSVGVIYELDLDRRHRIFQEDAGPCHSVRHSVTMMRDIFELRIPLRTRVFYGKSRFVEISSSCCRIGLRIRAVVSSSIAI